jgi:cytochrome P450
MLLMALHPEAQKKAQEEIDRVVGRHRLPNFEDRDSLPYVNAVVKEVLRWHPVRCVLFFTQCICSLSHVTYLVPLVCPIVSWKMTGTKVTSFPRYLTFRFISCNIILNFHKGTIVVSNIYGINRDPEFFPDPDAFRPERYFNDEEDLTKKSEFDDTHGQGHYSYGFGRRQVDRGSLSVSSLILFFCTVCALE